MLWPEGTIRYGFEEESCSKNSHVKKIVKEAMEIWRNGVRDNLIQFVEDPSFPRRLRIGCTKPARRSAIGEASLGFNHENIMNIAPTGFVKGTALHEIGHVLGLHHEHQREDRPLIVNEDNVDKEDWSDFSIVYDSYLAPIGDFDWKSVMIYGSFAASKNGLASMTRSDRHRTTFSDNHTPSKGDFDAVRHIFLNLKTSYARKLELLQSRLDLANKALTNCVLERDGDLVAGGTATRPTDEQTTFYVSLKLRNTEEGTEYAKKSNTYVDLENEPSSFRDGVLLTLNQNFEANCRGHEEPGKYMDQLVEKARAYLGDEFNLVRNEVAVDGGDAYRAFITSEPKDGNSSRVWGRFHRYDKKWVPPLRLEASRLAHAFEREPSELKEDRIAQNQVLIFGADGDRYVKPGPKKEIVLSLESEGMISGYVECQTFRGKPSKVTYDIKDKDGNYYRMPCIREQHFPPLKAPVRIVPSAQLKSDPALGFGLSFLHKVDSNEKVKVQTE